MRLIALLCAACLLAGCQTTQTAHAPRPMVGQVNTFLNEGELKQLFTGATVETISNDGNPMTIWYKEGGEYEGAVELVSGFKLQVHGEWKIKPGGIFCHREFCSRVKREEDGYARYFLGGNKNPRPWTIAN